MKRGYPVLLKAMLAITCFCFFACRDANDWEIGYDDSSPYLGTWHCTELNSVLTQSKFDVQFTKHTVDSSLVNVTNFNNNGNGFAPDMRIVSNTFTIPAQTVQGYTLSGSGIYSYEQKQINMSYNVAFGSMDEHYNAVFKR